MNKFKINTGDLNQGQILIMLSIIGYLTRNRVTDGCFKFYADRYEEFNENYPNLIDVYEVWLYYQSHMVQNSFQVFVDELGKAIKEDRFGGMVARNVAG